MCPLFEREIVENGVILIKYLFDVSEEVRERRFGACPGPDTTQRNFR